MKHFSNMLWLYNAISCASLSSFSYELNRPFEGLVFTVSINVVSSSKLNWIYSYVWNLETIQCYREIFIKYSLFLDSSCLHLNKQV